MALPIVSETREYKRFLAMWNRVVRFPDGREVAWDVVGHMQPNPVFVVVFPFNTEKKTTTLVREYAQGTNSSLYTLASGQYDRKKHTSCLHAAQCELAEEARLSQGTWIPLLPENHEGISELKWSTNKFFPWLVLNPLKDVNELAARDEDELISEERDVTLDELHQLVLQGELMLPSLQTFFMAQSYLQQNNYI